MIQLSNAEAFLQIKPLRMGCDQRGLKWRLSLGYQDHGTTVSVLCPQFWNSLLEEPLQCARPPRGLTLPAESAARPHCLLRLNLCSFPSCHVLMSWWLDLPSSSRILHRYGVSLVQSLIMTNSAQRARQHSYLRLPSLAWEQTVLSLPLLITCKR